MPKPPPDDSRPDRQDWTLKIYLRVSDTEPMQRFLTDLGRLCDRMGAGELTIEQATEELERVLVRLMGETL